MTPGKVMGVRTEPQFCPLCEVTLDLHDGPDSCEYAEAKARILEGFGLLQ
jgi:hypothetical protein